MAFWPLAFLLLLVGCSGGRWDVDTSQVDFDRGVLRLDKAVFAIDPQAAPAAHRQLIDSYGQVYVDYVEDIMRTGRADNAMTPALLMRFTTDPTWKGLQEHVLATFPQLQAYELEMSNALKRYAAFFGESHLPQLVAYNSGYNIGIYPTETWLGVGLEWYAGTDHKWVKMLPPDLFPQYKRDKMRAEFMAPNALRGFLLHRYREMEVAEEMLAEMVHAGKMAYIAQVLLEEPDELRVMNFSPAQLQWCRKKEYDIWKNLVERDVIFSTDLMEINKLMNDGPFTPGMPPESPGGVGRWIGYRMAVHYMEKNKSVSLPELLRTDARSILRTYKPAS